MRILRSESGKLPIVAIIAVVLVLALWAGAFAFLKASHKGEKAAGEEGARQAGRMGTRGVPCQPGRSR